MFSIDGAAEELEISKRSVRRLITTGELPAYRIGAGTVRIKAEDLEKCLKPIVPNSNAS
jgi:excisionase family DNA binding protein